MRIPDWLLCHSCERGGQQTWSRLNSSHFQSPGLGGDIHSFMLHRLGQILQGRQAVEHVISCYFNSVNTWFTIVEKENLETQAEELWTTGYPSAEIAMLILSMLLVIRLPSEAEAEMDDGLYQSAKTMCTLVETKLPWSRTLLQSRLLVTLYELSQGLPQQAYLSVGSCVQITREFGWHYQSFWSEERQRTLSAELKLNSLLWWALIYVDGYVHLRWSTCGQSMRLKRKDQPTDCQLSGAKTALEHYAAQLSDSLPRSLRPIPGPLRRPKKPRNHDRPPQRPGRRDGVARGNLGVVFERVSSQAS